MLKKNSDHGSDFGRNQTFRLPDAEINNMELTYRKAVKDDAGKESTVSPE